MDIASCIEHTHLRPDITVGDIDRIVEEAVRHQFAGICVPPFWVKRAKREIGSHNVRLSTVVGFPFGYQMTETKVQEIQHALSNGVDQVDVVLNLSSFKTGYPWTKIEIAKCSHVVHEKEKMMTVIIESSYLTYDEILSACQLCVYAGADYLQPTTGLAPTDDFSDLVSSVRKAIPDDVGIKISGEIATLATLLKITEAGATRIGTRHGISILNELHSKPHIDE